jgi:hypothetical protein
MAWSSLIGSTAAGAVDKMAKAAGVDRETRKKLKAGTMVAVGGTTALLTGDIVGAGLVAYQASRYAKGKKGNKAVGVGARVGKMALDVATGNIPDFELDALVEDSAGDYASLTIESVSS